MFSNLEGYCNTLMGVLVINLLHRPRLYIQTINIFSMSVARMSLLVVVVILYSVALRVLLLTADTTAVTALS